MCAVGVVTASSGPRETGAVNKAESVFVCGPTGSVVCVL